MNLASLSSADLHRILSLLEKRESLQADLAKVETEISGLQGGKKPTKPAKVVPKVKTKVVPGPVGKSTKAGKPQKKLFEKGALRNKILEVLEKAGKAGASIDDIAKALGAKASNLSVWFARDSKKIEAIYKIRRSVYGLKKGK